MAGELAESRARAGSGRLSEDRGVRSDYPKHWGLCGGAWSSTGNSTGGGGRSGCFWGHRDGARGSRCRDGGWPGHRDSGAWGWRFRLDVWDPGGCWSGLSRRRQDTGTGRLSARAADGGLGKSRLLLPRVGSLKRSLGKRGWWLLPQEGGS